MGYKTRSNYALGRGLSQERWNEIFGKKCPKCKGLGKYNEFDNKKEWQRYIECETCKRIGRIK